MSKKEVILSSTPTIFLKGLVPTVLYSEFESGKFTYFNLEYIKIFKINLTGNLSNISTVGKDSLSDIFTKNNTSNNVKVFCTDNCSFFNVFNQGINENTKCYYCRRKFSGPMLGSPVKYERFFTDNQDEILVFHCVTCDCSFECANSSIDFYVPEDQRALARTILNFAFEKSHPGKTLKKALDWRLLKENGGSLEESDYISNTHRYVKLSNVVFCPIKNIYEKIKNA